MDFSFSPEQEEARRATIEFARKHLNDRLPEREKTSEFSREAWQKCADFGILGLYVPEAYGGQGRDIATTICILEALGYGCKDNGLAFSVNAHMWTVITPILAFGIGLFILRISIASTFFFRINSIMVQINMKLNSDSNTKKDIMYLF